MKLYLDDERTTPEDWVGVKTPEQCIDLLLQGGVTHLSLDHDLGLDGTGYDVLTWIENSVVDWGFVPPEFITIHSANAGARMKMELAIWSIKRLANKE